VRVRYAGQASVNRVEPTPLGVQCSRILPLHGWSARERAQIRLRLAHLRCCHINTSLRSFDQMVASGWRYTVCAEPKTINLVDTDLDVWACFFVLSKIFEFFDTILKILLKKDFIFLHWYHHLATAYLCWLSLAYNFAPVRTRQLSAAGCRESVAACMIVVGQLWTSPCRTTAFVPTKCMLTQSLRVLYPQPTCTGDLDRGSELYSARTDVLLLLLVFGAEQKMVHHYLQTGGADHHNHADLADGCTLID
jgi:hypothetical protein